MKLVKIEHCDTIYYNIYLSLCSRLAVRIYIVINEAEMRCLSSKYLKSLLEELEGDVKETVITEVALSFSDNFDSSQQMLNSILRGVSKNGSHISVKST